MVPFIDCIHSIKQSHAFPRLTRNLAGDHITLPPLASREFAPLLKQHRFRGPSFAAVAAANAERVHSGWSEIHAPEDAAARGLGKGATAVGDGAANWGHTPASQQQCNAQLRLRFWAIGLLEEEPDLRNYLSFQ